MISLDGRKIIQCGARHFKQFMARERPLLDVFPFGYYPSSGVFDVLRRRILRSGYRCKKLPCDTFLFAFGDTKNIGVTKCGGRSDRPKELAWPTSTLSHIPLQYMCQIDFTKSKRIVPAVPGDLLIIFFDAHCQFATGDLSDCYHYEWYHIRRGELIPATGYSSPYLLRKPTPRNTNWKVRGDRFLNQRSRACQKFQCQCKIGYAVRGIRWRTFDMIGSTRKVERIIKQSFPNVDWEIQFPGLSLFVNSLLALKIGGLPAMVYHPYDRRGQLHKRGWEQYEHPKLIEQGFRFLCSIPSIKITNTRCGDGGILNLPKCPDISGYFNSVDGAVNVYLHPDGRMTEQIVYGLSLWN